uniref:Uncharacterized protein n=2 Tax=Rhodnius prolixus TaxID=13249 RepID=T1HK14_RHOPR
MSTGLEDIRKFRGKPWSAWTDFIGFKVPPELTENSAAKVTNECQSMLLNKSDIPIFGHCPTAEILELAICNFCGDKLKLPALLDHINTRHEETKSKTSVQDSSTNIINDKINDDNCRNNNNANKSPRKSTQQRYAHTKLNKECNKFNNNNKALSLSNGKCNANNLTSHHHHLSSSDITANGRPLLQVQVHLERSKLAQKLTNCKELGRTEATRGVTSLHDYKLKQIQ